MQAVILAAGRGTRMEELTGATPKPMLTVLDKTLLEYKFEAMPEEVSEIILIIGYLGDMIRARYGGRYGDKKLSYIEQKSLNGTAGALWEAKDLLHDRFLVLNGDDIFSAEDLHECAEDSRVWKLLVQEAGEMQQAGAVQLDEDAHVVAIVEGDYGAQPGLVGTNSFALDTRIFTQPMIPKQEGHSEYGLPQTVIAASKALEIPLEPVFTTDWIQVTAPGDLTRAAKILGNLAA